jgi:CheY-like chemotaxis protein
MVCTNARTVHVPLSQCTVAELHAGAAEFRGMAATARTAADAQGLTALGARYDALASRRDHEVDRATVVSHPSEKTHAPGRPMGAPSAEALVMAGEAIARHFVLPETRAHPVIQSATRRLAYTLMAYGLVPTKAESVAAQPDMAVRQHSMSSADQQRDIARHLLVVDDVADVLVTVGAFLANEGFTVHRAATGDEALRLIASDPRIDVLVTDYAMPGLSGAELIGQATQIRPFLKALVITGYPNADGLAELPPQTSILVKPFRRDTLVAGVRSLLGDPRPVPTETSELIEHELVDQRRDG